MGLERINRNRDVLIQYTCTKPRHQKSLLKKADDDVLKAFGECILNGEQLKTKKASSGLEKECNRLFKFFKSRREFDVEQLRRLLTENVHGVHYLTGLALHTLCVDSFCILNDGE